MTRINRYLKFSAIFLSAALLMQLSSFYTVKNGLATINVSMVLGKLSSNEMAIFIATGLIAFLIIFFVSTKKAVNVWIVLLLAGAFSNLIDRLVSGGAVDYFSLPNLFAFNIADLAIMIGTIGLLISFLKIKTPS